MSWMGEVLEIFKFYTERSAGSEIEAKKNSIRVTVSATAQVGDSGVLMISKFQYVPVPRSD